MQYDDDGTEETHCTTKFPQYTESFVQEIGTENGAGIASARTFNIQR